MTTVTQRAARFFRNRAAPRATATIIGVTALVFVLQLVSNGLVTNRLGYAPVTSSPVAFEPWRALTTALVHSVSSPFHLLFNMASLWMFGRELERLLGWKMFLGLYVVSVLGGSAVVGIIGNPLQLTIGSSGGIFGLFAAYFVILRRIGGSSMGLLVLIGINFALGFIVPGVSWQAHLGGVLTGAAFAAIMLAFRGPRRRKQQRLWLWVFGGAVALLPIAVQWLL